MEFKQALYGRRSCRMFSAEPVSMETISSLLDAAQQAPSPLNGQPWKFTVIINQAVKQQIISEAEVYKDELMAKSNWKWLLKYDMAGLRSVPLMVVVSGIPEKSGADLIMESQAGAWRDACGAAIQTMLLCAESFGLASLWFTMFSKERLKSILKHTDTSVPLAIVMIGKAASPVSHVPRRRLDEVTQFIR